MAVGLLALLSSACGNSTPMSPSGMATSTTPPASQSSVSGTWSGTASDSSSALGAGAMMGQAGMGTPTWQLSQSGTMVTGTMSFGGMQGHMPGTLTGTMSGNDMTFTVDMPNASMMSSACTARATGTAHLDPTTMTMTCTYSGSNSCSGPFGTGQMNMSRR
ncbi:MAG: hypothetical protein IT305_23075 [Chloroflexi bacterium]|nr:hypothetical protein [Chloroflexota bacterium]